MLSRHQKGRGVRYQKLLSVKSLEGCSWRVDPHTLGKLQAPSPQLSLPPVPLRPGQFGLPTQTQPVMRPVLD